MASGGGVQIERLYSTVGVDLSELHSGLAQAKTATGAAASDMARSFTGASSQIDRSISGVNTKLGILSAGSKKAADDMRMIGLRMQALYGTTQQQAAAQDILRTSGDRLAGSMKQTQGASRMLGVQLGQVSTQLLGGANAAMVFAQQGPDIAWAMQGASGAVGRFASFMTGPFGAAVFTAVSVLGMLGLAALDAGDDMDEAADKANRLKASLESLGNLDFNGDDITAAVRGAVELEAEAARIEQRAEGIGARRLPNGKAVGFGAHLLKEADAKRAEAAAIRDQLEFATGSAGDTVRGIQGANEERFNARPDRASAAAARKAQREAEAAARKAQREAEQEARAQQRADEQFRRELETTNLDLIRSRQQLANSVEEEAALQLEMIDAQEAAAIREIETQERWNVEQKGNLIAMERQAAANERLAVIQERDAEIAAHASELHRLSLEGERDLLSQQFYLATTAQDRRRIALELVELDYQLAEHKLLEVLASETASQAERERAAILLKNLEAMKAGQIEGVKRANVDVLSADGFGQELGRTLEEGILAALKGKSLKDAMRDGLTDFLHDATTEAFANLSKVVFGQQGLGGALGGLFSGIFGGQSRAAGGPVLAGMAYNVGMGEKFVAPANGRILSREDAKAAAASGGARVIKVEVDKSPYFDTRVREISDGSTQQGIGTYDRAVGSRVDKSFKRRGG